MTNLTGLEIETARYKQMVIRDVNNYFSEYLDYPDVKYKGCFEIDKEMHKDQSMRIVPIALSEYFIKGIPIETTIKNHKDIYDFCIRLKTNSKSVPYFRYVKDGVLCNQKLNRTTRYYISNSGGTLNKAMTSGRDNGVSVGEYCTLLNQYEHKDNYNINYSFYIKECYKIIDIIENKQIELSFDG